MIRSWRTARRILRKLETFVAANSSQKQWETFDVSIKGVEGVLDEVVKNVEDKVISDLKERV